MEDESRTVRRVGRTYVLDCGLVSTPGRAKPPFLEEHSCLDGMRHAFSELPSLEGKVFYSSRWSMDGFGCALEEDAHLVLHCVSLEGVMPTLRGSVMMSS